MRNTRVAAAAERVVVPPLSDLPPGASTSVKDFGTTVAVPVSMNRSSVCNTTTTAGHADTGGSQAPVFAFERTSTSSAARYEYSPVPGKAGCST